MGLLIPERYRLLYTEGASVSLIRATMIKDGRESLAEYLNGAKLAQRLNYEVGHSGRVLRKHKLKRRRDAEREKKRIPEGVPSEMRVDKYGKPYFAPVIRVLNYWTKAEKLRLRQMRLDGIPLRWCAEELDRSLGSAIGMWNQWLGGRNEHLLPEGEPSTRERLNSIEGGRPYKEPEDMALYFGDINKDKNNNETEQNSEEKENEHSAIEKSDNIPSEIRVDKDSQPYFDFAPVVKTHNYWTKAEKLQLRKMRLEGIPLPLCAEELDRSLGSVTGMWNQWLGGQNEQFLPKEERPTRELLQEQREGKLFKDAEDKNNEHSAIEESSDIPFEIRVDEDGQPYFAPVVKAHSDSTKKKKLKLRRTRCPRRIARMLLRLRTHLRKSIQRLGGS